MAMLTRHLNTLEFPEIVHRLASHTTFSAGRSLAEEHLADFEGPWKRSVEPAFSRCVF